MHQFSSAVKLTSAAEIRKSLLESKEQTLNRWKIYKQSLLGENAAAEWNCYLHEVQITAAFDQSPPEGPYSIQFLGKAPAPPTPKTQASNSISAPDSEYRIDSSPCGFTDTARAAISDLDASLCSNPNRACGLSGWVTDPQWQLAHPNWKGGAL